MNFYEWKEHHKKELETNPVYAPYKTPKELCSDHRSNVVDVTIACSMITTSICTTCGLE